ncbi:MAG: nitroreductase [Pseudomonadales bacterium]|nr:nitroreductase [Pseudomonadales bacterium]
MNVTEALTQRTSIRQFKATPVPQNVLDEIIDAALNAPSSSNTQAYRIAVATDDVCDSIRNELSNKFSKASKIKRMPMPLKIVKGLTSGVLPDGDFNPNIAYPKELKQRSVDCGMGLYQTLGIERHDHRARERQMQRNFEFFDAPVAIFLFIHEKMGVYGALDSGIFLQSLMLAATERGLGTCAQGALGVWGSPVRRHFQIEKDYKLICGLSLGYPDDHVVNDYRPVKRTRSEVQFSTKAGAAQPVRA